MYYNERQLPTFRWDELTPTSPDELRRSTVRLLSQFYNTYGELTFPPRQVAIRAAGYNIDKRISALERGKSSIEAGEMTAPFPSYVPTFMNTGYAIEGIEDTYLDGRHPSQELFAYNRLGKESIFNRRFGQHCLTALRLAYPKTEITDTSDTSSAKLTKVVKSDSDYWALIATKTGVAHIQGDGGREASVISRSVGAICVTDPLLSDTERDVLKALSNNNHQDIATLLANKAVLLDLINRHTEETRDGVVKPVMQTVYITQAVQSAA